MSAQDQRPRYYEGQYLGAADLEAAIDYARLQHARHLLAGHTWGIAAGLHLVERAAAGGGDRVNVYIEPGYAWDGFGRPILLAAPQPVPESKFAAIEYDAALDADGKGRLVAVWLRYVERRLSPPAAGFGDCLDVDARARVQETFEIVVGARGVDDRHAAVLVAGTPLRVDPTAVRIHPQSRIFYDETVPHQALPELPSANWLVPIGYVRWLPVAGGPGRFVKRSDPASGPRDSDVIRRFRRYVGAVTEEILAADQAVRIRDRSRPPSTAFQPPAAPDPAETDPAKLPTSDLLFVEGATRIEGDARLLGGQLDMLTASGSDGGVPLRLRRTQRTVKNPDNTERTLLTLEAQIGVAASADNRFAVGPLPAGAPLDEKLTVLSSGNVGIGTADPVQRLHVTGNRIRLENGTKRLDLRADGSAVDVQSDTSKLYLRSSGPGGNNHVVMNHAAADGNVGIGTENPTHKLHVNAKAGLRQNALYLSGDAGWSSVSYNAHHDDANGAWLFPDPARKAITIELDDASGNTRMEVYSNASATPGGWRSHFKVSGDTDRVAMAYNGGSVGIGTTAPAQKLHVAGDRVRLENAGKRLDLRADGSAVDVQSDTHNLYIHSLGPAGQNHVFLSPHSQNGNVGIGTTAPLGKLHVAAGRDTAAGSVGAHVAVIDNTSTAVNASVLALRVGRTNPGAGNNFVTFFRASTAMGCIEASGTNTVALRSGGADFAECLDLADAALALEEGEVVGVFDGRATRRTTGAQHVSAVTARAIVVGNDRGPDAPPHARVAFMGQVPVKVRGPVRAGDCIVASGREDGTGIAVPADRITAAQLAQLVGQAWESSNDPGVKRINTAIGVAGAAPVAALAADVEALRRELRALRASG